MRYERPQIADLGSIAAHTFMPDPGNSQSHKGFNNLNGDHDCELSHSFGDNPNGPGHCDGDDGNPSPNN
ncbi:MAG TPA: hypothetical protein VFU06_01680 [Longimicrobiales bacterium]|nr:hypothetical protein [Longimicrobiales bacterium]